MYVPIHVLRTSVDEMLCLRIILYICTDTHNYLRCKSSLHGYVRLLMHEPNDDCIPICMTFPQQLRGPEALNFTYVST